MSSLGRSPRDSPIRNFGRTPPSASARGSRARSSEPTLPSTPSPINTHTNGNGLGHGRPSNAAGEQVRYTSLSSLMSPTSRSNGNGWMAREPESPSARRFNGSSSSPHASQAPHFGDSGMSRIAPPPKEAPRLSTLQLIALTVSMGGSQVSSRKEVLELTTDCMECRARIRNAIPPRPWAERGTDVPRLARGPHLGSRRAAPHWRHFGLVHEQIQASLLGCNEHGATCYQRYWTRVHATCRQGYRRYHRRRTG